MYVTLVLTLADSGISVKIFNKEMIAMLLNSFNCTGKIIEMDYYISRNGNYLNFTGLLGLVQNESTNNKTGVVKTDYTKIPFIYFINVKGKSNDEIETLKRNVLLKGLVEKAEILASGKFMESTVSMDIYSSNPVKFTGHTFNILEIGLQTPENLLLEYIKEFELVKSKKNDSTNENPPMEMIGKYKFVIDKDSQEFYIIDTFLNTYVVSPEGSESYDLEKYDSIKQEYENKVKNKKK